VERRSKTEVYSGKFPTAIEKDYKKYLDQDSLKQSTKKYSDIHSKPSPKPDIKAYIEN
jgi:hypothetical protein